MLRKEENRISIFNEVMVSVYLTVSITLTDYSGPNQKRAQCGNALVGIVLLVLAANLLKFLFVAMIRIAKIFRMRYKAKCRFCLKKIQRAPQYEL